jgi:hypothetical protein
LNADTLGYKEVLGGAIITNILSDNTSDNVPNEDQNNKQTEKLPISDKEPIYVDGLNLLYSYPGDMSFEEKLYKVAEVLSRVKNNRRVHLIIKSNHDLSLMKAISKKFPIVCHVANTIKDKNIQHHLKGQDDFLVVYLSSNGYCISNDKFRDYKVFREIKPFTHFTIENGKITGKEKVKPNDFLLTKPSFGNFLNFKFIDRPYSHKNNIHHGDVIINKKGERGTVMFIV